MTTTERELIRKAVPMGEPGVRTAVARLRRRGFRPEYLVRLRRDRFCYLVRMTRKGGLR